VKINDADFGPLDYDDDLEAWTGRLETSCFADCAIKWDLSPAGSLAQRESEGADQQGSRSTSKWWWRTPASRDRGHSSAPRSRRSGPTKSEFAPRSWQRSRGLPATIT
jgi:hypothetical protein